MRYWLCIALLALAGAAHAFEAPLTYARGQVSLVLHHGNGQSELNFDAEIRAAESVANNPGWYNFAGLDENKAAMLLYASPTTTSVKPGNDYAAHDILFVDSYGVIHEILPSLIPANLEEAISSKEPMIAILYLKSGICAKAGISPGDQVVYGTFRKRPVILDNSSASPVTTAPAAPIAPTITAPAVTSPTPLLTPVPTAAPLVNPVQNTLKPITPLAPSTSSTGTLHEIARPAQMPSGVVVTSSSSSGMDREELIDRILKQNSVK